MDVHSHDSGLATQSTVFKSQDGDQEQAQNATETRTDLKLLLECVKCHMNDATVQRDSLLTIATMCSGSEATQEIFREIRGINVVLNLLTSVEDPVRIAALYMLGCACEKNVFSQKRLCTIAVFKFLYCQLTSSDADNSLKRIAAFLVLCLVTNNGEGQNLARTSKCLDAILKLFRTSHPLADSSRLPGQMWLDTHRNIDQLDLWTSIIGTLCGCVNNPQNEKNQQLCASAFPTAVTILSKTKNPRTIRLVSSFLSLTVASSEYNQDRFGILGGPEILASLLQDVIESLLREPERDYVQAAVQLANLFVSCSTDSEQNYARLVNLNLAPLLIQLLSMEFTDLDDKLKIIVTLGHLTEKCERSQRQFLESDGLRLLVHIMTEKQDEEFIKAAMYLLGTCVNFVPCLEGECKTNNKKMPTPRKQKTAERRDNARVNRASLHGALHSQQDSPRTLKDLNARVRRLDRKKTGALGVYTASVIATNSNDKLSSPFHSQLADADVINDLEVQFQEKMIEREQLKTEKEEIKRQRKIKESPQSVINEKAEAITRELERQYKEQQDEEHECKQEHLLVMQTPEKLSKHCSINGLEQKIAALEKKVHFISAEKVMKQITGQQSISQTRNKSAVPDVLSRGDCDGMCESSKDPHNTMAMMSSDCLPESENRRASDQNKGSVRSAGPHQKESQNKGQKSAMTGKDSVFRVPTAPVPHLRRAYRSSRKDKTLPMLNDMKRYFTPSQMESDRESQTSNTTYQSTELSFTSSDMALFQPRVQLVDIMCSGNPTPHRQELSAQRGNLSFKLKHTVQIASTLSRPVSELTQPKIIQNRASEDNRTLSKNVFRSSLAQSDFSGKSSAGCSNQMLLHSLPKCPGCAPPVNRPLLNSRNFLYTLERSRHTCSEHRDLHRRIKHGILQQMTQKHIRMVFDYMSQPYKHLLHRVKLLLERSAKSNGQLAEALSYPTGSFHKTPQQTVETKSTLHEPLGFHGIPAVQTEYTHVPNASLLGDSSPEGSTATSSRCTLSRNVRSALRTKRFPRAFSSILPKSMDRQLMQEATKWSSPSSSKSNLKRRKRNNFTEQEVKNLIKGVAKKGKHWNAILWGYEFQPGRTSVDLKDKYRRMQASSDCVGVIKSSRQSPSLSGKSRRQNADPAWHP